MMGNRSVGDRVLGLLFRLLPADFRGDFGDQMAADLEESRAGNNRPVQIWRREVPALAGAVVREHLHVLASDIRFAFRLMRRTPGFTALAVLMLGLGTGANVAMFSIIDPVLLRSPFPDVDSLAIVQVEEDGRLTAGVPSDRAAALMASPRTLSAVASLGHGSHLLTGQGDPQRPDTECVSASMFDVLGTRPWIGRTFTTDDDRAGAAPTIVLSYPFWRQLGGDPRIVGRALHLNEHAVTVVGVMPPDFEGPFSRSDTAGWMPLNVDVSGGGLEGCRAGAWVNMFARVQAGLSLREAEQRLPGFHLLSLQQQTFEEWRTPFVVLSIAVWCVLLIACLNVGGLQIERAVSRRPELALRLALGASRARLVGQTLTENLALAGLGGAAGVAAAYATLHAIVSMLPTNMPHLSEIALNGRALAAAIVASIIAGLVAGIFPVAQSWRLNLATVSNDVSRRATSVRSGLRRTLIAVEIALSVVVLVSAGLMIQTFFTLRPSHPGFDPSGKDMALVRLPGVAPDASGRFFMQLFDQLRNIPGVRSISGSTYLPMFGVVSTVSVMPTAPAATRAPVTVFGSAITPGYLDAMNIPVLTGRAFTDADTRGAVPVALVNEQFARNLVPDGDAVGQRVRARGPRRPSTDPDIEWEIVGVVGNTRTNAGHTRFANELFVPYAQSPVPLLYVVVDRGLRPLPAVPAAMRRAIHELKPDLVLEPVIALDSFVNRRVDRWRLGAWLLGGLAALAVILAAVGLMTTIGWWVRQRQRELGIRIALGARWNVIVGLLLGQGMRVVAGGIVAGCALAALVSRFLEGWIYGVTPLDVKTFVMAALVMLLAGLCATLVPTRRAIRLNPVAILRAE
jgi:putative ABC transport system permease protein